MLAKYKAKQVVLSATIKHYQISEGFLDFDQVRILHKFLEDRQLPYKKHQINTFPLQESGVGEP